MEDWVQQGLQADLTLLFDVSTEVSQQRLAFNQSLDRFEQEKQDFFTRVRETYLARAETFPQRIRVIDSSRNVNDIQTELGALISALI